MRREILLYTAIDGKCPVKDFLDSLPEKVFQKVSWVLMLLTELDKIPSSYFKKMVNSDDIWECRIIFGSNSYRIFCFFHNGSVIILTHGIIKKSQKIPKNEIRKAEAFKSDFIRRNI